MVGLQAAAPYYVASGVFMVITGVVGYLEWGRYVSCCLIISPASSKPLLTDISVAIPGFHRPLHIRISHYYPPYLGRSHHHQPAPSSSHYASAVLTVPGLSPCSQSDDNALHRYITTWTPSTGPPTGPCSKYRTEPTATARSTYIGRSWQRNRSD